MSTVIFSGVQRSHTIWIEFAEFRRRAERRGRMWYSYSVDGTPFGRYRLLELLGAGGMGQVYRAYDTETSRTVALKVLPREFAHDETYRERFRREARATARLTEPHIVPIHAYGEIDGRLFLDMRLVEGADLGTLLAAEGRLPAAVAVERLGQIAGALDAAHAAGLVHRDVKPSNILVTAAGFAYLIDFGIAVAAGDSALTTVGSAIGTFAYMAPERLTGGVCDARSDVYSLSCVLYQCLTGVRPFPGDSVEQLITAHLSAPPPRPSAMDAGLVAFDAVIARGMAKDSTARYDSAGELLVAAGAALEGAAGPRFSRTGPTRINPAGARAAPEPDAARPKSAGPGSRDRMSTTVIVIVLIALITGWVLYDHYSNRAHTSNPVPSVTDSPTTETSDTETATTESPSGVPTAPRLGSPG
ncbi:protein kinase [Nocardia arthritidis]|uniref:non-specific serine/threonine protein kinase n=1 Tax=Nocardia arthritidis TaxID=228602 RepID=A0A6G9YEM1_9NOCA|nr:protein kinase [Nocardia arthritidis]